MNPRIVEVRQNVLRKNDQLARALRCHFDEAGVFVVSLVSSPGAGKTALLEQTLSTLRSTHRVGALVGDLATDRDAQRLRQSGAPVHQIVTGTVCHLNAEMITAALHDWDLRSFDVLFIENVGNLVCPASYDLGEHARVVLMSVTEGEDKPAKYPTIFNTADLCALTKIDLADAVGFDREAALRNIRKVRGDIPIVETSARADSGLAQWFAWLHRAAQDHAHGKSRDHFVNVC